MTNVRAVTVADALAWLADVFQESQADVQQTSRREDIPGWDSLGQLVLISQLDERFDIRLTDGELAAVKSVPEILAVLETRGLLTRS